MIWLILLALLNGVLIGVCRSLNGRLSQSKGAFVSSFHNHWVGAAVLTLMILLFTPMAVSSLFTLNTWSHVPWLSLTGGVLGAFYVAINSHVLTQIGALKAALFVISGQMITGVLFAMTDQAMLDITLQLLGVGLIIVGMYFNLKQKVN
ncbi:MAG: DMT family transporter [Parashewanella sp.]